MEKDCLQDRTEKDYIQELDGEEMSTRIGRRRIIYKDRTEKD